MRAILECHNFTAIINPKHIIMERKSLFVIVLLATLLPLSKLYADPEIINLQLNYEDPDDMSDPFPRSPILVPVLYLDGYTLTAGDNTLGSTIQLLDEDGTVVFSTYVYIEGDINLPTILSGTYTIRVIRGSQTFEGSISL